jgi:hypothetical protein
MWRHASLFVCGLLATACATTTPYERSPNRLSNAGRDVLTAAEIVASSVTDVYQAVTQLRPDFLRRRQTKTVLTPTPAGVSVYLDDLEYGGPESLRQIPLERVRIIRYMRPFEAELRFGGRHPSGAILVQTMKR